MRAKTVNSDYRALSHLGHNNRGNRFNVVTSNVPEIGVAVIQAGAKKATVGKLLVPGRTLRGSRRAASITLNGAQLRALYETLDQHFALDNNR
jgi:hypothetical protein